MTCYGVHDYTLARNGKQRCQRCGYEYPPIWAWWAKDDPVLRAKVLRVDKPRAVVDGQMGLFGEVA